MEAKSAVEIKEIKEIYDEATLLGYDKQFIEALKLFEKVIDFGESPYLSGAYATIANIILHPNPLDLDNAQKAKFYVEKALEIKPANQIARITLVKILIVEKDFSSAIKNFLKVTKLRLVKEGFSFFESLESFAAMRDSSIIEAIPEIEKLYDKYKTQSPKIGSTMGYSYLTVNNYHKAYNVYKELIEIYKNEKNFSISFHIGLSLVCSAGLNNAKEGIEVALNGIKLFNKQNKGFKNENSYLTEALNSNLAMGYLILGKFEKVIGILSEKIRENPNNTDLHNLAHAYYKSGDYDKALKYCTQALYIMVDETSLFIKGEALFYKEQFVEALRYYKSALSFIQLENTSFVYTEIHSGNISSSLLEHTDTLKNIYLGIINSYIQLDDYDSAKAAVKLGLKEFPYENNLLKLEQTINTLLGRMKNNEEEFKVDISKLQIELEYQKEKYLREMSEVRNWAEDLLKIQNRYTKNDELLLKSEADWGAVSLRLHKIALQVKEAQPNQGEFEQIKIQLKEEFPNLSQEGLTLLATGEFLYQVHFEKEIDFAPIVIEFARVIELELNNFLKRRKITKKNQNLTLGQMNNYLHKIKIKNLLNISGFLEELKNYRNSCAHTGQSTREIVQRVRNMILHENWLKVIIS
ncbi:tetratricopeptide repeat protein [Bacillus thuringiensis]|nr:tetratricopeptide repeat protein [Bacillus thuringiensis]